MVHYLSGNDLQPLMLIVKICEKPRGRIENCLIIRLSIKLRFTELEKGR